MYTLKSHDCPGTCHFIQDRHDPDRYTCLPCGKVRYTSSGPPFDVFLGIILVIIVISLFISSYKLAPYSDDSLHDTVIKLE